MQERSQQQGVENVLELTSIEGCFIHFTTLTECSRNVFNFNIIWEAHHQQHHRFSIRHKKNIQKTKLSDPGYEENF